MMCGAREQAPGAYQNLIDGGMVKRDDYGVFGVVIRYAARIYNWC